MFDFRKNTSQSNGANRMESSAQMKGNRQLSLNARDIPSMKNKPLTPIKETSEAKVIIPPSRSVMDPDNQILFLDNGQRIVNPINAKTPPPPFWGEVLEEENYDPNEPFYDDEKA